MSIRHALLAVVALSIALPAAAQSPRPRQREVSVGSTGSMTSEMSRKRRRTMSPYLMNGFGLGAGLINISKKSDIDSKNEITLFGTTMPAGTNKFDDTSSSGTNPGLTMSYSMIRRLGIGFTADLTYTEVSKLVGEDSYGFLRPAVNFAVGGARNFYGFAGVNTTSFTGTPAFKGGPLEGQKINLRSQVGWQAGAGYVNGSLQIFGQYSSSKIKIDEKVAWTQGLANLSSTLEGGIDLSGFELIVQYRF